VGHDSVVHTGKGLLAVTRAALQFSPYKDRTIGWDTWSTTQDRVNRFFSSPNTPTGSGALPALYSMGKRTLYQGLKWQGCESDHSSLPCIYKACPSESGTDKFMQKFI